MIRLLIFIVFIMILNAQTLNFYLPLNESNPKTNSLNNITTIRKTRNKNDTNITDKRVQVAVHLQDIENKISDIEAQSDKIAKV